jgi:D-3-phosphoglycerate dehydrogenase
MLNKSRGEVAYNLIDIGNQPSKAVLNEMHQLEGVINVRLIGDCAS